MSSFQASDDPARDTSPNNSAPPLPDEPPPLPTDSLAPPLPTEEEPAPPSKPARKATVVEVEDEDDQDDAGKAGHGAAEKASGAQEEGEEDDGEEWDPSKGADLTDRQAVQEKTAEGEPGGAMADTKGWQAVWAPQANAYYFWNANTNETTWTNPLVPPPSAAATATVASTDPDQPPLEQPPLPNEQPPLPTEQPPLPQSSWGQAYGGPSSYPSYSNATAGPSTSTFSSGVESSLPPIDPGLAHLLPKSSSSGAAEGYQSAQFNARTGRFTPANFQYTVDHLAEANRAKRQEGVFFDVGEWEKAKERDWAERKRKEMEEGNVDGGRAAKLTKADMVSDNEDCVRLSSEVDLTV